MQVSSRKREKECEWEKKKEKEQKNVQKNETILIANHINVKIDGEFY